MNEELLKQLYEFDFVKIPNKAFEIQTTQFTQKLWEFFMQNNPSYFKGTSNPIEQVSYNACLDLIQQLNLKQKDYIYRLPSEEEWEYCCRAGSTTEYCFGNDVEELFNYVWFYENSNHKTQAVGLKNLINGDYTICTETFGNGPLVFIVVPFVFSMGAVGAATLRACVLLFAIGTTPFSTAVVWGSAW